MRPKIIGTDNRLADYFKTIAVIWIVGANVVIVDSSPAVAMTSGCEIQSNNVNGLVLFCKGRELVEVPKFDLDKYPHEYYELTLADNKITELKPMSFDGLKIKMLDLSGNKLQTIDARAFAGIPNGYLTTLILSLDELASFPSDSLSVLTDLKSLTVTKFDLNTLSNDSFQTLSKLAFLTLQGSLQSLDKDTFKVQRDTLTTLDLSENKFTSVPYVALSVAVHLKHLKITKNDITILPADALKGMYLETLDMSRQTRLMTSVSDNAFRGLESCLRNLSLDSIGLTDKFAGAVKILTSLVELNLPYNRLTRLSGLFVNMLNLLNLNLQGNPIVILDANDFSGTRLIRLLNLAENNITMMNPSAFKGLLSLEELDLSSSNGIVLEDQSFMSQRSSLRVLKMTNSKLQMSDWSAITSLSKLQSLYLSKVGLTDVPQFAFRGMGQLKTLDLSSNNIEVLQPWSMAGLENSLESLNLIGNNITTLDRCVLHGFASLDLFKLSLANNPLQCNCSFRWLHRWRQNVTGDDVFIKVRIAWKCADRNRAFFRDLKDSDFADCPSIEPACPNWKDSDTTLIVSLIADEITESSVSLYWSVPENTSIAGFHLQSANFTPEESAPQFDFPIYIYVESDQRNFTMTGLLPARSYVICLREVKDASELGKCVNVTTLAAAVGFFTPQMIAIVAASGGALVCLIVLIICCCCCCCCQSRSQITIKPSSPKVGDNSKRFMKPQTTVDATELNFQQPHLLSVGPSTAAGTMTKVKSIAEQLESMSEMEKYRLINLITHSGGSMASLDMDRQSIHSSYRYRTGAGIYGRETALYGRETGVYGRETGVYGRETGVYPPYGDERYATEPRKKSIGYRDGEIYEDIPDDGDEFYDEISVDEIV